MGAQAAGASIDPDISADGRYVAFESEASNLVRGDTNGAFDVFVRDLGTGTTSRLSVAGNRRPANDASYSADISADGRYVAFHSAASNLVPGDTNGVDDVFLRNR
jgi:TolB protein